MMKCFSYVRQTRAAGRGEKFKKLSAPTCCVTELSIILFDLM
jgi:hypothetical protein